MFPIKTKKITASYSESRLNTLALYLDVEKELGQIIDTELDKLYAKTLPKDVQKHLQLLEQQEEKAKAIKKPHPDNQKTPPSTSAEQTSSIQANSSIHRNSENSRN